jgi:hypothetical protein
MFNSDWSSFTSDEEMLFDEADKKNTIFNVLSMFSILKTFLMTRKMRRLNNLLIQQLGSRMFGHDVGHTNVIRKPHQLHIDKDYKNTSRIYLKYSQI